MVGVNETPLRTPINDCPICRASLPHPSFIKTPSVNGGPEIHVYHLVNCDDCGAYSLAVFALVGDKNNPRKDYFADRLTEPERKKIQKFIKAHRMSSDGPILTLEEAHNVEKNEYSLTLILKE